MWYFLTRYLVWSVGRIKKRPVAYSETYEEVYNTRRAIHNFDNFLRWGSMCLKVTRQQMIGKEMKWLVPPSAESSTGRFRGDKDEGATSGQKSYGKMIHEAGLRRKNY
jgi:hypothetical protein